MPFMFSLESTRRAPMIESPCTNVCTVDARSGLCVGCGRTLDEIARWSEMSDAERSQIMRALPARRAGAQTHAVVR
jgi:predicted Fe-S protein YdhL (DUF1289 family)